MNRFAALYEAIDRTTSTNAKVEALAAYFGEAPAADAAWALFFLTGRRVKRLVSYPFLFELARDTTGLPEWLLGECLAATGDMAEALALLVDARPGRRHGPAEEADASRSLDAWMRERILPLVEMDQPAQGQAIRGFWDELGRGPAFLLNKLLTGEFRVGVSATLVVRSLARAAGVAPDRMAHRVMGDWEPSAAFFSSLLAPASDGEAEDAGRPYPFFLASPLEGEPSFLGDRSDWLAEWKWDGIRAQLVRRKGQVFLWSRGEERIADRFPEVTQAAASLPDGLVLDGEVLAYRDAVLPFALLQRRIGRRTLTAKVLREAPAVLMAYDLLEEEGQDLRALSLRERRARLEQRLAGRGPALLVSPVVDAPDWDGLARLRSEARSRLVEGLMLKRLDSPYSTGRKRGDWWKWKIGPHTVDAILLYAHPGHGKRASLFTDYTFGVFHEGVLVPIARAYSGLNDEEIRELDTWIRGHTTDKFGPVRAVPPVQVFELGFEGIAQSSRHKSGIAVRFPRILRWRKDKPPAEADSLETLRGLLASQPGTRDAG